MSSMFIPFGAPGHLQYREVRFVPLIRVICAWCPGFNPKDASNRGASHGICSSCAAKIKKEMEDENQSAHPTTGPHRACVGAIK
jgi:hypothetical protein